MVREREQTKIREMFLGCEAHGSFRIRLDLLDLVAEL